MEGLTYGINIGIKDEDFCFMTLPGEGEFKRSMKAFILFTIMLETNY